jgi:hypothetical protein
MSELTPVEERPRTDSASQATRRASVPADANASPPAQPEPEQPKRRVTLSGADIEKLTAFATPLIRKESARWRRASWGLVNQLDTGKKGDDEEEKNDEEAEKKKSVAQRTFEKAAVSFSINTFVVIVAYVLGSITSVVLGLDIGVLIFWINQLNVCLLFAVDKGPSGMRRMDNPSNMDKLTAAAQVLPLLWLLMNGYRDYMGMLHCVFFQVVFKTAVMISQGEVISMVL